MSWLALAAGAAAVVFALAVVESERKERRVLYLVGLIVCGVAAMAWL